MLRKILFSALMMSSIILVSCSKTAQTEKEKRDDKNLQLIAYIVDNHLVQDTQEPLEIPVNKDDSSTYYFDYIEIIDAYQFTLKNPLFDELVTLIGQGPYRINVAHATTYYMDKKDNKIKPRIVDLKLISIISQDNKAYTILDNSGGYIDDYNYTIFSSHKRIGENSIYKDDILRGQYINLRETKEGIPFSIGYMYSKEFIDNADFSNLIDLDESNGFIKADESKIYDVYSKEVLDSFIKEQNQ